MSKIDYSEVFGPTDSVAGTKTTVGTANTQLRPNACHIYKLRVAKGNVVNAKECAGVITVEANGLDGTFEYAYGNGAGGATNSGNSPAEEIDCSIPIPKGSKITVSVTDSEIAKDVTVSTMFYEGTGKRVDSYSTGGAGHDTTADTEYTSLTAITPTRKGTIREIRISGSGVVDAKAGSGKLELDIPGIKGPFNYAFGNGPGGATLSGPAFADVIDLPNGIPVDANVAISPKAITAEVLLSLTVSIQVA